MNMANLGRGLKGVYRDVLTGAGGRVLYDSGWTANTVVDSARSLLAAFVANRAGVQGIQYLAVGEGESAWDANGTPAADPTATTALVRPYHTPWTDLQLDFLDDRDEPLDGNARPTLRLQIKATLPSHYPEPSGGGNSYPLREFGLFGRIGGEGGEPYMINCIRHPVIYKDVKATLERVIRLYF